MRFKFLALATAAAASPAMAQAPGQVGAPQVRPEAQELPDPSAANVEVQGFVYEPRRLPANAETMRLLKVPQGFRLSMFAQGLKDARMLAIAPDGTVYVTRRDQGDVLMLPDRNRDGRADESRVVAQRPGMHGITIHDGRMYLAAVKDVYVADMRPDGTLGPLDRIIDDLPDAGQHPNRTVMVGPDNMLYISVGSTCNACAETNDENATILRAELDGTARTIYARGLRNTFVVDWHPQTGQAWGWDHGIDWLGNDNQREEWNRIEEGRNYGWPYIYGEGGYNPQDEPPGGMTMQQWDAISERPVLTYDAHSSGLQMAFYEAAGFPAEYQGDAFVSLRGSWNRKPPSGYEVVRVRYDGGKPVAIEPFITGFLQPTPDGGHGFIGRLAGLAVAPDGALLFSDDENGVIYRVTYEGPNRSTTPIPAARAPAPPATNPALAMARPGTQARAQLNVTSPDLRAGAPIPATFSAYGEGVSPALSWSAGPQGTRSYVILMEDPDAARPKPFVHWIAYNIPAGTTSLRQALPRHPRLEEPADGILQGVNSRGSVGYFGPRPPAGDGPHDYHFQVFALDRMLDVAPGANRETVLGAMKGHVLASGEVTGTYARAEPPRR